MFLQHGIERWTDGIRSVTFLFVPNIQKLIAMWSRLRWGPSRVRDVSNWPFALGVLGHRHHPSVLFAFLLTGSVVSS
jgi:hypothetical protein